MFAIAEENAEMYTTEITAYFIELYNDQLVDLFYRIEHGTTKRAEAGTIDTAFFLTSTFVRSR